MFLAPYYVMPGIGVWAPLPNLNTQCLAPLGLRYVFEIEPAETVERTAQHPLHRAQPVKGRNGDCKMLAITPDRQALEERHAQEEVLKGFYSHFEPRKLDPS